jgi:hypothetical protein
MTDGWMRKDGSDINFYRTMLVDGLSDIVLVLKALVADVNLFTGTGSTVNENSRCEKIRCFP